jgi:hypothetical protein
MIWKGSRESEYNDHREGDGNQSEGEKREREMKQERNE